MTYIVKDECIKCKLTDCVEVCPVDCFYEGENMLVINPDECIDCGVCEPECPIDAIVADDDPTLDDKEKWLSVNTKPSIVNMFPFQIGFSIHNFSSNTISVPIVIACGRCSLTSCAINPIVLFNDICLSGSE